MGLTYFKRFRMEIDLLRLDSTEDLLPAGYRLLPWEPCLLEAHADAKYLSFRAEIDANVFPCLGNYEGCVRLMYEIANKEGFLGEATWLLVHDHGIGPAGSTSQPRPALARRPIDADGNLVEVCGTVQGVRDRFGLGSIQNLGVTPDHRGRGLGWSLLRRALLGFRASGLRRAFLEVTAQNEGAIRLYRRMGFVKARTVYKAVDVAACTAS